MMPQPRRPQSESKLLNTYMQVFCSMLRTEFSLTLVRAYYWLSFNYAPSSWYSFLSVTQGRLVWITLMF
jgi:hypothetical protein